MADTTSFRSPFYADLAAQMEAKHSLPLGLLYNIVTKGEKSNADRVSKAGARTVAQIMPATRDAFLKKYGIDAYASPENALEVAALHLKEDLERTGGDVTETVARYIAGPSGNNRGPETRAYVKRVTGQSLEGRGPSARATTATAIPPAIIAKYNDPNSDMTPGQRAKIAAALKAGRLALPEGETLAVAPSAKTRSNAVPMSTEVAERFNTHSDMTEAQRRNIEGYIEEGYIVPPPGVVLKRPAPYTAGQALARGAGLLGRDIIAAPAAIADLVTSPIRVPVDTIAEAMGYNPIFGNYSDTAAQLADEARLPAPQNAGERMASTVSQGAIGGALTAGAGSALAGAPGAVGIVGRGLSAAPIADVVGGASGGAAQNIAAEAGAGPVGQTVAALAGGVAGGAGALGARGALKPRVARVVETTPREVLFDQAGVVTEEGLEQAARAGVTPDELRAAYDPPQAAPDAPPVVRAADEAPVEGAAPAVAPEAVPEGPLPATAAARVAEAQAEGVDLTRAQATKDFAAADAEQSLKVSPTPEGEQVRAFFERQAQQIDDAVTRFKSAFGDPEAPKAVRGELVQTALRDLRDQGRAGVSALYRQAEEAVAQLGDNSRALLDLDPAPLKAAFREVFTDPVVSAAERDTLRQLAAQHGLIGKAGARTLEDGTTLVEIPDATGKTARTIELPRPVEPLTVTNAERLRQDIGALYNPMDGRTARTQGLKTVIDDAVEAALTRAASAELGEAGAPASALLRQARAAHAQQKATFAAKDVVQRLIDFKKGTKTDAVLPENAIREIFKGEATNLKKIKAILLSKPTEQSRAAWQAIQAQGIGDLFDKAFTVNARNGEGAVSGAKLNTAIRSFGAPKLKVLLGESDFNALMRLKRVIGDATIPVPNTTNPSGTAGKVISFLARSASGMTGLAKAVPLARDVVKGGEELLAQASAKKTVEGVRNFTPQAAVKAESGSKPPRAVTWARDFLDLATSDRLITPIVAAGAQASEQPPTAH